MRMQLARAPCRKEDRLAEDTGSRQYASNQQIGDMSLKGISRHYHCAVHRQSCWHGAIFADERLDDKRLGGKERPLPESAQGNGPPVAIHFASKRVSPHGHHRRKGDGVTLVYRSRPAIATNRKNRRYLDQLYPPGWQAAVPPDASDDVEHTNRRRPNGR